ncbi:SET domain-containing protein [Armillaria solidipes]|uniref:SET domain-containing protein n=1 Tax=Armillaria solidipes TaxID=1076256 RepID=A0A2H3B3R6_9AGAR|nr:SET domain-containing protein [Armillaria solidipes]
MTKTHRRRSSRFSYLPKDYPILPSRALEPRYITQTFHFGDFKCATLLHENVKKCLPRVFSRTYHDRLTFETRRAGSKGLGLFARCGIPAGSIILVEHPLIVMPRTSSATVSNISCLLSEVYLKERTEFMNLANSHPLDDPLKAIMQTNRLLIDLPVDDPELAAHHAVFLKISRCNHSCSPNAHWKWDPASFSLTLEAVRDIGPREEITIQYIDSTVDREQRLDKLRTWYNFDCLCPSCTLPRESIIHSDFAREELSHLTELMPVVSFEKWCASEELSDDYMIRMHQRALELREAEGLQLFESRKHVDAIAMCYGALGDVGMFRYWTEKAMDLRAPSYVGECVVLDQWMTDPRRFPVWGWRNRRRG